MPTNLIVILEPVGLALLALLVTTSALSLVDLLRSDRPIAGQPSNLIDLDAPGARFLFDGRDLVLASSDGAALLALRPDGMAPWDHVMLLAEDHFAEAEDQVLAVTADAPLLRHADDHVLEADLRAGMRFVSLGTSAVQHRMVQVDPGLLAQQDAALAQIKARLDDLPVPSWAEAADGRVSGVNRAYLNLTRALFPGTPADGPFPRLFTLEADQTDPAGCKLAAGGVTGPDARWFTCHAVPAQDGGFNGYALPASETIRAERTLQTFVQTMTDTFAHLATGLVVFDKSRRLVLFNPAFTELTGLDPAWLTSRPTLASVLDRMREHRVVPEPKDYRSWRDRIVAAEEQARQGSYQEDWPLADGRTFRVTGRPHPKGAVAFLIEDITPELSRARQFRAELDLVNAVLDDLDEAVAVFSTRGTVLMTNSSYVDLWGHDPNASLVETFITDCTRLWSGECAPSPAWGDLRDFVGKCGERCAWGAQFDRLGGGQLQARFQPLPGGRTLVAFQQVKREAGRDTRAPAKLTASAG